MPNELTPADLDAIAARCEKATPGPWRRCAARDGRCTCGLIWSETADHIVAHIGLDGDGENNGAREDWQFDNGAFIAAARSDVPALITALRAAWEEVERLRAGDLLPYEEMIITRANYKASLLEAMRHGAAEEREACAKAAEVFGANFPESIWPEVPEKFDPSVSIDRYSAGMGRHASKAIAEKIRSRGSK